MFLDGSWLCRTRQRHLSTCPTLLLRGKLLEWIQDAHSTREGNNHSANPWLRTESSHAPDHGVTHASSDPDGSEPSLEKPAFAKAKACEQGFVHARGGILLSFVRDSSDVELLNYMLLSQRPSSSCQTHIAQ